MRAEVIMPLKQRLVIWLGIAAFLIGAWLLLTSIAQWLGTLPGDTRTAVIGLTGIVLVPFITFFTTRSQERRRARDDAIREKRTDFYDKTIRGMIRIFNIDKTQKPSTPDDMAKLIASITPEFVLYASRGVVLAWNRFREAGAQTPPNEAALLAAFEDLLREMRKDLGHEVPTRPNFELLKMFVTDIDSFTKRSGGRKG